MTARLGKGGQYWFISLSRLEPRATRDWRLLSDDGRWESGNYFTDYAEAEACGDEVREFALPLIEGLVGRYKARRKPAILSETEEFRGIVAGVMRIIRRHTGKG